VTRYLGSRIAFVVATVFSATQAYAKDYIVKFKSDTSASTAASFAFFEGGEVKDSYARAGLIKVDLGTTESLADEAKTITRLLARPDVEYVVEDFKLHSIGTIGERSGITDAQRQWALDKVNAAGAWSIGKGSRQVTVAVIDTGADYTHSNLKDNMVPGYNFIENNDDPQDIVGIGGNPGHGTHCSGIIGARGIEGGTIGITPHVSIMPLRFLDENGQGDLLNAIRAIDYAVAKKVDVVSASWGASVSESQAQPLIEAIGRLNDAGIVFVAAAGNEGANNDRTNSFPSNARLPNVIAVAASNSGDGKPYWSNYGRTKVALAAPGDDIISTLPGDQHGSLSGTSMATPLVAGLVALLKSQYDGTLGPAEAKALLQTTGEKVKIESACNCRINAAAAADALHNHSLTLVPTAHTFTLGDKGKFAAFGGSGIYTYSSDTPDILAVKEDGTLEAKALGDAIVKVTDSRGEASTSISLRVVNDKGADGKCPFIGAICQITCTINPNVHWCPAKKSPKFGA